MTEWIPREAALAKLGVRPQTLYAYVSRGRIGTRPDPDDPRRSLYCAEDVALLQTRHARGRKTADIASSALAWGEPTIATAVSTVHRGALIYRGRDAVAWAETATLEETAALLWPADRAPSFKAHEVRGSHAFEALARLARESFPTAGRSGDRLRADAETAIGHLAASVGVVDGDEPLHCRLARHWRLGAADTERVRRALVLTADHELNASAFAARVVASTGASVAAGLLAGLCALSGPLHGGAGGALTALLDEAAKTDAASAVAAWLARGHPLPGFGHPLYPHGDPRAAALLQRLDLEPTIRDLQSAAMAATGAPPNIDFALAAFSWSRRLPRDAPFSLFLIGRSVGWAAHVFEQAESPGLIRPRARYHGRLPESPDRV